MATTTTHKSACILCSVNCGIDIEVDHEKREFVKITGDKDHPTSQGYICQKATRLNYYVTQKRLTSPLKKNDRGEFEEISWDQAIKEIADKLVHIRDTTDGKTIAYAGGGGQGNHMAQMYAVAFRKACETPYIYSSLAQEKTGNFWVHGKLFGKQSTNYAEPLGEAEYVMVIGSNPIQSHGIPRARKVIGEISRDPNRTLVVIDPRNTETAQKADHFMQITPGRDAWLMSAILGYIIQNGLEDKDFIAQHTNGFSELKTYFEDIPVEKYCNISGVPYDQMKVVVDKMVAAKSVTIRSDLGIEMSYNSTLNAYLKRLLFLVTGNFNKHGCNHLGSWFVPLIGHSKDPEEGGMTTQVTGAREISKLYPPNVLSQEIDSDHPMRLRALIVDSTNPVLNWADTNAQKKAYKKLDLMVTIDVTMTETALESDYVLPAANQFEKYETTFFSEEFIQLRRPIFEPLEGTLDEPEIYTRLIKAMGAMDEIDIETLSDAAEKQKENPTEPIYPTAFMAESMKNPAINKYSAPILRETFGKILPHNSASAAFLWFASQMYANKYPEAIKKAGFEGKGGALGHSIFQKVMSSPSGVKVSKHEPKDSWDLMKTADKRVNLHIPELLDEWLVKLPEVLKTITENEAEYPFNLIAGERRAYNANAIIRNLNWSKTDQNGALKINAMDARELSVETNDVVRLSSRTGSIKIVVEVSDQVKPGVLSMPHGKGMVYGEDKDYKEVGAMPNILTDKEYCDPIAKTPYHKNVRVKVEKVEGEKLAVA